MISSIVLVVVFISVLITIHEFGHLIVAKLAHIPVEIFSLGFGPVILKKRFGETEYRLSLVPLGGFIKMLGEEEKAGPGPEEKATGVQGYADKPLYVRVAVIAAGPVSNLILGFLFLFLMYSAFGVKHFAPVVDPAPNSRATAAGLAAGDIVLFAGPAALPPEAAPSARRNAGEFPIHPEDSRRAAPDTIPSFEALERAIERNAGRELELTVLRGAERLQLTYAVPKDTWDSASLPGAVVSEVKPGSPAAALDLQPGDTIVSADGIPVETWDELTAIIRERGGRTVRLAWRREGVTYEDSLVPALETDPESNTKVGRIGVWSEPPRRAIEPLIRPVVGQVRKTSPAARAGIRTGDTLVSVAGIGVNTWADFTRLIGTRGGRKTEIVWRRSGELLSDSLVPGQETDQLTGQKQGEIGVWAMLPKRHPSLGSAALQAAGRTGYVVVQTFVIIYNVVTRRLPGRAIGGPIMVAKIAYEGANWGAEYFIALWALLSINLFVVNMLPVPVLDGGRILLDCIAAIRRRRLTEKEMAWAGNIGWLMIGALVLFTVFNDILRLIRK